MAQSNYPDPNGDVTLVVGAAQVPLKVSSHVLSLASPVLATLLGPTFKEGTELQAKGQLTVPLPEDNPDVFRIICDVLHFRSFAEELDFPLLLEMATAVHYYMLAKPLQTWAERWLQPHVTSTSTTDWEKTAQLLWISFALEDHKTFAETSKTLLLYACLADFTNLEKTPNCGFDPGTMLFKW